MAKKNNRAARRAKANQKKGEKSQVKHQRRARPMSPQMVEMKKLVTSNIALVAENTSKLYEALGELGLGYKIIDGSTSKFADLISTREKAREYRRWGPYIIAGSESVLDWAYSKTPDLKQITKNEELQSFINTILLNTMTSAFNSVKNAEHALTDGDMVVMLIRSEDGFRIAVCDVNVDEYDKFQTINNPNDPNSVWLHRRDYNMSSLLGESQEMTTYYPDAKFWPTGELQSVLEERVAQMNRDRGGRLIQIDWNNRIMRVELNGGVPIVSPAIPYFDILDKIIGTQTSVLATIAAIGAMYSVDNVDEAEEAEEEFYRMSQARQQGEGDDSYTLVGSGSVSTMNLNIAMLAETTALYRIVHNMIYNAFPGIRPQDFAEAETGGLSSASNKNEKAIISGQRQQDVWSEFYKGIFEAAYIWQNVLGSTTVAGVSVESYGFDSAGHRYIVYQVLYEDEADEIKVTWPNIQENDVEQTVSAISTLSTLGGTFSMPIVTRESVQSAISSAGLDLVIDDDLWDELTGMTLERIQNMPDPSEMMGGSDDEDDDEDKDDSEEDEDPAIELLRQTLNKIMENQEKLVVYAESLQEE